jgi:hypothetical protein
VLQEAGQAFVSVFKSRLSTTFATNPPALYAESTDSGVTVPFPALVLQPGTYLITALMLIASSNTGFVNYCVRFTGAKNVTYASPFENQESDPTQFLPNANMLAIPGGGSYVANTEMPSQVIFMCHVPAGATGTLNVQIGANASSTAVYVSPGSIVAATKLD